MPWSSLHLALALGLLAPAAVHGAAPITNAVNEWSKTPDVNGVFTASGGVVTDCTADMDVFPNKAKVSFGNFSVEYKNNYKIVTNKGATPVVKYLLWQRGCPKPADADDRTKYAASFEVPLRSVALTSSTYFGAMEVMGERAALKLINDFNVYSSSPCLHEQVDKGSTALESSALWEAALGFYTVPNATSMVKVANKKLNDLKIEASFVGCNWNTITEKCVSYQSLPGLIQVANTRETTFYAEGEWIEYHAVFFNRELEVMEVTDMARERWLCHSASKYTENPPKVLVLSYFNRSYPDYGTYKGWEIAGCHVCNDKTDAEADISVNPDVPKWKCGRSLGTPYDAKLSPSYKWCELVKAAGGVVVNEQLHSVKAYKDQTESPTLGPWIGYQPGSKSGFTDAQLIAFAKDVDVIILKNGGCYYTDPVTGNLLTGDSCNTWWSDAFAKLTDIKAVKEKRVWDLFRALDPSGGVAWLSQSVVEPDVMLEDMIKAISNDASAATKKHQFAFFRDNFAEGFGNRYYCKDEPKQVGCIPDLAELKAQCTDHSDILPLIQDGCSGAPANLGHSSAAFLSAVVALVGLCW